jgi:hypothetical protein
MPTQFPDTAVCLGCGYLLRGLPKSVCPECGRAFDPADPSTYRDRAAVPKWRRWAKPPRRWHLMAIGVLTFMILWEEWQPPAFPRGWTLACVSSIAIPLIFLEYVARALATYVDRRRSAGDRLPQQLGGRWRWYVTPLCLALLCTTAYSDWPLQLRFTLSRSAFEQAAEDYSAGRLRDTGPQWIGLFRVEEIGELEPGVPYFMLGYDWLDAVAFVDRAASTPSGARTPRKMSGTWYLEWW